MGLISILEVIPMNLSIPFTTNRIHLSRNLILVLIIVVALVSFEMFNYSTTDYALSDLLGNLTFLGLRWSTILSIAFCGIDFAGLARLFTPERGSNEPKEIWYLTGAWFLGAAMNATLTWWGVSMAIINHQIKSTEVMDSATILKVVPIFVALMVWVIRILIIGSISFAGERLLQGNGRRPSSQMQRPQPNNQQQTSVRTFGGSPLASRPSTNHSIPSNPQSSSRPEPTYHNNLQ